MKHIYNANGLPFFDERQILLRRFFEDYISKNLQNALQDENRAWQMLRIEAPQLTPVEIINQNYTSDDVWFQDPKDGPSLVLRPETTPGTYSYAEYFFGATNVMPPICIWQSGKSFRREQDQPTKHCRFKEFYQQEFQCFYSDTTKNDYQNNIAPRVEKIIEDLLGLPTRLVDSDRLPSYSLKTIDVEVNNGDKWMEVCSISLRTDFKYELIKNNKSIKFLVLEIAVGLDRLVYNFDSKTHNTA